MPYKELHTFMDYFEHLWEVIAVLLATFIGGVKLWWWDKREIKRRIAAVEILAESNDSTARKMIIEMQEMRKSNDDQHGDIMDRMIALFNGKKK